MPKYIELKLFKLVTFIEKKFIPYIEEKEKYLDIKEFMKLKEKLEKLIREKEKTLLENRKTILLKFKSNFPVFKKEIAGSFVIGIVVYFSFVVLNFFYGYEIYAYVINNADFFLIVPIEFTDASPKHIHFTYELPLEIYCFPTILQVPWMFPEILDVYNCPLAPMSPGLIHLYYHPL